MALNDTKKKVSRVRRINQLRRIVFDDDKIIDDAGIVDDTIVSDVSVIVKKLSGYKQQDKKQNENLILILS